MKTPEQATLDARLSGHAMRAMDHARWAVQDRRWAVECGTQYIIRRAEYHERQCREIADYIICERAHAAE